MSGAVSLYRRHRPRSFADASGGQHIQEHVVRTLRHAIERGRVHHAYLFVGPRGTGKTSMAKILAASLNCENGGPTVTPCGHCESCRSIANATSLDVIEMDAASNNSVDDIRELRESVAYAPVSGRSKVYILDEAHMLSPQAWNAFLKTLEEPPPDTIFVLATTEAAKILPTVVDRCHRFDFARPTLQQIAGVLRRVAAAEGIEIGDEAVALIARSATGSFRDALGTLEQLVAYSGETESGGIRVELPDVLAVLGAADSELVLGTVDAVASGNARDALLAAARLAESGRDVARFFSDLEGHARGLMVLQALGGSEVPDELRVTADQDARLLEQAGRVAPGDVVRLLDLLAAGVRAVKDGSDARTQLELALVKAATPSLEPTTKALLARLERLESAPARPVSPRAPEVPATAAGLAKPAGPGRTSVGVAAQVEQVSRDLATEADPAPAVAAVAVMDPSSPTPEHATVQAGIDLDLPAFAQLWPAVLESIAGESRLLAASLAEAKPAGLDDRELRLAWGQSAAFSKQMAENAVNQELIAQAIRAVTGTSLRLALELRSDADHAAQHSSGAAAAPAELTEDELIARLVDEFDATELPPDPPTRTEP